MIIVIALLVAVLHLFGYLLLLYMVVRPSKRPHKFRKLVAYEAHLIAALLEISLVFFLHAPPPGKGAVPVAWLIERDLDNRLAGDQK
jgi:hypothetical protein